MYNIVYHGARLVSERAVRGLFGRVQGLIANWGPLHFGPGESLNDRRFYGPRPTTWRKLHHFAYFMEMVIFLWKLVLLCGNKLSLLLNLDVYHGN